MRRTGAEEHRRRRPHEWRVHLPGTGPLPPQSRDSPRYVRSIGCFFENGRAIGVRLVDGSESHGPRGRALRRDLWLTRNSAPLRDRPAAHLRELGIPVTQHLPGSARTSSIIRSFRPIDRDRGWCAPSTRRAPGRSSLSWPRRAAGTRGTTSTSTSTSGRTSMSHSAPGSSGSRPACNLPAPRACVRLTSADPMAPLDIDHAYLSDPADLEAQCDGIELVERIIASAPMQRVLEPYAEEAPPWGDAGQLPAWTRSRVGTTFHPSSTCRMGPASDPMAVVDHDGRVRRVAGLRIVDASIFPTGPRANIHFTSSPSPRNSRT